VPIDVQGPDGSSFSFPDDTPQDTISSALDSHYGSASSSAPSDTSTLGDVAKSAGIGLAKGAIGLAGLPGDAANVLNKGIDWAESKFGITPQPSSDALTSGALTRAVESVTGPLYKPKTTAGEYAQTIGEFVPNLIGGPEGLATKAATRVLAPALASETAGQVTKGTPLEPVARVAGAMAGQGAAAGLQNAFRPKPNIPTVDELHAAATQGYLNARGYGVEIKRQPVSRLADDMFSDLGNDGFRERNIPKTWAAIDELRRPLGRNATIDDIDSVRKALNRAGANPLEGAEREASRRAIAAIDNYMATLDPRHVAINPHYAGDVSQEIENARGNWAAMKRAEDVNFRLNNADLRAASTGSGGNIDNATRQNIRAILTNKRAQRGFSKDELAQMERVVRGTFTGNVARLLGKLAPTGIVSAGLGLEIGSHLLHGPAGLGAVPIAGAIAKKIGDASTARQARVLDEMVRSRSPLARSLPQPPAPIAVPPSAYAQTGIIANQSQRASGGRIITGAEAVRTRKESHYSPTRGVEAHHCGPTRDWPDNYCKHFIKPNRCAVVGGQIAARGGCDFFVSIKERASGGAVKRGDGGGVDLVPSDIDPYSGVMSMPDQSGVAPPVKALFGLDGTERYQTWPERLVRSATTAPLDALTGKMQVSDPETGMPTPEAMERASDVAGMAGIGGMPMAERGALGMAGGRLKEVRGPEPSDPNYVYHATNEERAQEIADSGLKLHGPSEYTDQDVRPDGSTQKRNYFTPTASNTWQFAPEEGRSVLLRVPKDEHPFKRESTGDIYSTKPVPPEKIEALDESGNWSPLKSPDYRGQHTAPDKESGAPLWKLNSNGVYPDDFYHPEGFRYYADYGQPMDRQAYYTVNNMRNKPNGFMTIYRAVPKDQGIKKINPGDWVAITRQYAEEHGESALGGNYKILKQKVRPRDLFTNGDSLHEWGYDPQPPVPYDEYKSPEWLSRNTLRSDTSQPGIALAATRDIFGGMPTYSAAGEAVRNAKMQVGQPSQWLGYLKNQQGVKQAELEHVGLEDWLKSQTGAIPKAKVEEYIQSQQPEIQEVRKGAQSMDAAQAKVYELNGQLIDKYGSLTDAFDKWTPEEQRAYDEASWAAADSGNMDEIKGAPKYAQYQLPGGSNYGETLLTLPPAKVRDHIVPDEIATQEHVPQWNELLRDKRDIEEGLKNHKDVGGNSVWAWAGRARLNQIDDELTALHNRMIDDTWNRIPDSQKSEYRSAHWDEPNVLLHVRHNDRMVPGPNGEQVPSLHIEELQSDAHQQGRKLGYQQQVDPVRKAKLEAERDEIVKGAMDAKEELDKKYNQEANLLNLRAASPQARREFWDKQREELEADPRYVRYAERINQINDSLGDMSGKVPNFPFKTTWPDLGLKRMLHRAATETNPDGTYKYHALSWTPGEAQAARYDLSKHIKEIEYIKYPDGNYRLGITDHNGEGVNTPQFAYKPEELPDVVGKEVADKIINDEGRKFRGHEGKTLSNLDLKVGGEGMKAFYDKMLVDKANALTKKYGAKVQSAQTEGIPGGPREFGDVEDRKENPNFKMHKIWMVPITPELRAAASKGFPTFSSGGRV
jgi:hypothetical protein